MTNSSNSKVSKKLKIGLISAAVTVIVLCIAVIIGIIAGKNNPENNRIIVYSKNNNNIIRIDDKEKVISLEGSSGFKCDDANSRVFFTTESGYSEGLYDLYYVEIEKGEITDPKLIDYAVEKNFNVSSGKVYYLKFNNKNSANDGCVCNIDENRIEIFSQNVEEIYDSAKLKYNDIIKLPMICNATNKRQTELQDILEQSDLTNTLVIIVGDKSSNNCTKLFELSRKYTYNSIFISTWKELRDLDLSNFNTFIISSGTSTPLINVEQITKYLQTLKKQKEIVDLKKYIA